MSSTRVAPAPFFVKTAIAEMRIPRSARRRARDGISARVAAGGIGGCTGVYSVYTSGRDWMMNGFERPRPPLRRLVDMLAIDDWIYRDAHYLAAEMEVDPEAAARWVPAPLRLAS